MSEHDNNGQCIHVDLAEAVNIAYVVVISDDDEVRYVDMSVRACVHAFVRVWIVVGDS